MLTTARRRAAGRKHHQRYHSQEHGRRVRCIPQVLSLDIKWTWGTLNISQVDHTVFPLQCSSFAVEKVIISLQTLKA